MQNIDNLGDTILVAATNHAHLLDPAIGRRFHYKMELKAPIAEVRYQLFSAILSQFSFTIEEIETFVKLSDGLTGAEIEIITFDYLRKIIVSDMKIESIELIREILAIRFDWLSFRTEDRLVCMKKLQEFDNKIFTKKFISQLWDMSQSNVTKIFKEYN